MNLNPKITIFLVMVELPERCVGRQALSLLLPATKTRIMFSLPEGITLPYRSPCCTSTTHPFHHSSTRFSIQSFSLLKVGGEVVCRCPSRRTTCCYHNNAPLNRITNLFLSFYLSLFIIITIVIGINSIKQCSAMSSSTPS